MAATRSPRRSNGLTRRGLLTAAAVLATAPLRAQTFPAKPIQLIVPLGPGGINDIISRLIAQKLTESWGQPVVVVNKPGAEASSAARPSRRPRPTAIRS
jgi:tripartite-type tricarboxylate transporter receptor subunit TctC